jgi:hypothetical protein
MILRIPGARLSPPTSHLMFDHDWDSDSDHHPKIFTRSVGAKNININNKTHINVAWERWVGESFEMPHSQTKVLDFHLHCVCNRLAVEWKCTAPVLDGPSDGFEHARCLIFRASSFLTNDGSESLLKCHSHKQRQVTFIFVTLTTGWQWSGNTERLFLMVPATVLSRPDASISEQVSS